MNIFIFSRGTQHVSVDYNNRRFWFIVLFFIFLEFYV